MNLSVDCPPRAFLKTPKITEHVRRFDLDGHTFNVFTNEFQHRLYESMFISNLYFGRLIVCPLSSDERLVGGYVALELYKQRSRRYTHATTFHLKKNYRSATDEVLCLTMIESITSWFNNRIIRKAHTS